MLFSSSVTLKKPASLESFQQRAIRANGLSNRETQFGTSTKQKKTWFKLEGKKKRKEKPKPDSKISTLIQLWGEGRFHGWISLLEGKRWRSWRWEEPELWVVLSFSVWMRTEARRPAGGLSDGGLRKDRRLMEGRASAVPEMTWSRSLGVTQWKMTWKIDLFLFFHLFLIFQISASSYWEC